MGRQLAALVAEGRAELDMAAYDVARLNDLHFDSQRWLNEGTQESEVSN